MSSIAVNNTMGSDSRPALQEDQFVMFSIIDRSVTKDRKVIDRVTTVILSSKEERAAYWDVDFPVIRCTPPMNALSFIKQFTNGYDRDYNYGYIAHFLVRTRTGERLYNLHYTNCGIVELCKVKVRYGVSEEVVVSSGYGGEWIKVLSAIM
jgi:hypothetical protein